MHRNAPLTPAGRLILCQRVAAGRPVAHVAAEMGISRTTGYRWWNRYRELGAAGLVDRSSRPHTSPNHTPATTEAAIIALRVSRKLGPVSIAAQVGLAASTVYRVLVRHRLNRLAWLDRPTGRVIRRYERDTPGELVHIDIKKLGRIPDGGGWRVHGRGNDGHKGHSGVGYAYLHAAVDDHSRVAYVEVLADERKHSCADFWRRARAWYADHGIVITEVLTDNGPGYRSKAFAAALGDGVKHRFTKPYRPQTNGKVERFNRTMLDEWAYVRAYPSEQARTAALANWLHTYNHHRSHTSLGGHAPMHRVTNLPEQYN